MPQTTCLRLALSSAAASIFLQLYLKSHFVLRIFFQVFLGRHLLLLSYCVHLALRACETCFFQFQFIIFIGNLFDMMLRFVYWLIDTHDDDVVAVCGCCHSRLWLFAFFAPYKSAFTLHYITSISKPFSLSMRYWWFSIFWHLGLDIFTLNIEVLYKIDLLLLLLARPSTQWWRWGWNTTSPFLSITYDVHRFLHVQL